jgi:hypothetical protein
MTLSIAALGMTINCDTECRNSTKCHLCCGPQLSLFCWVSLCWMSFIMFSVVETFIYSFEICKQIMYDATTFSITTLSAMKLAYLYKKYWVTFFPKNGDHEPHLGMLSWGLTHKHCTWAERLARDKHFKLFRTFVNYDHKKIYKIVQKKFARLLRLFLILNYKNIN